jgi:DivIVA domain-containing protein
MITPSQIREKKISTVESGGYDRDEVNELLLDIIESYEAIYDENKELYRKMEVLANRIEQYRADEDSIKTALITAQKMASQVTREAKEQADKALSESAASAQKTVVDAKEKADKIIGEARDYVASFTKEKSEAADEIVLEAQKKANEAIDSAKIVAGNALTQAKKLASEIVDKARAEKEYHTEIVAKLKTESKDFRSTLVGLYENQLEKLKDMIQVPESFDDENESIEKLENELNELIDNITQVVGDDEPEVNEAQQEEILEDDQPAVAEDEPQQEPELDEVEDVEDEIQEVEEETSDAQQFDTVEEELDEVDKIIDEIESNDTYSPLYEAEEEPITEEDVSNAIDAFSTDEITPIDESAKSIPVIDDEPEFESTMPFENYFHVKKESERTNETISLIPPEDDDDDDNSKFKGFFKKKK